MEQPLVPAARPVFSAEDRARIAQLIDTSLQTGSLTLGPVGAQFEELFARIHGIEHAVAVSSGTSALEIALRAFGVEGRDVVVPTNTFFATAAAVIHAGGRPVLADVDPSTMALSPATIEAVAPEGCAGVVLVHIGGLVTPHVEEIAAWCRERGMFLLEDAAHAQGATYDGRSAGTFGDAGTFSFYPTKVMTSGEGGMIVTNDTHLVDEAKIYRDQGKAGFLGGEHVRLGYAWRMSEIHAAVGLVQLERLEEFVSVRQRVAKRYDDALASIDGIDALPVPSTCAPNYYKYIALLRPGTDRDQLKQRMRELGVAMSGEVYASPLHHHSVFASLGHDGLAVAEDVCARHVCLPVHSDMTDDEADRVISALEQALTA